MITISHSGGNGATAKRQHRNRDFVVELGSVPLAKRQRVIDFTDHSGSASSFSSESMMGVESTEGSWKARLPSEDDVLVEMIQQSGAKSYDEVVSFCLSAGIPLSRMLRLDLMRQSVQ